MPERRFIKKCSSGFRLRKYKWLWLAMVCMAAFNFFYFQGRSQTPMKLKYFSYPVNILIYKDGSPDRLDASNSRYPKILELMHNRMNEPFYLAKLAVNDELIEHIKAQEIVVEFIYSKLQSVTYLVHKTSKPFHYTRLLFPLTGPNRQLIFFGDDNEYFSGPLGQLSAPAPDICDFF